MPICTVTLETIKFENVSERPGDNVGDFKVDFEVHGERYQWANPAVIQDATYPIYKTFQVFVDRCEPVRRTWPALGYDPVIIINMHANEKDNYGIWDLINGDDRSPFGRIIEPPNAGRQTYQIGGGRYSEISYDITVNITCAPTQREIAMADFIEFLRRIFGRWVSSKQTSMLERYGIKDEKDYASLFENVKDLKNRIRVTNMGLKYMSDQGFTVVSKTEDTILFREMDSCSKK